MNLFCYVKGKKNSERCLGTKKKINGRKIKNVSIDSLHVLILWIPLNFFPVNWRGRKILFTTKHNPQRFNGIRMRNVIKHMRGISRHYYSPYRVRRLWIQDSWIWWVLDLNYTGLKTQRDIFSNLKTFKLYRIIFWFLFLV